MEKEVEIRAVIKYLCKKGMSPRKSMKTLLIHFGRSRLPIALWKNELLNLRGAWRALEMMSGLVWSCATEGETCQAFLGT
jgi:hypothetical protein